MVDRLGLAIALAALAGCATAPSRFYTLDSTATAESAAPAMHVSVLVGPVFIPAAVDRPEFVLQLSPNEVQIEEFNRWGAPLGDAIGRVVANDLATLLGTADVAVAPAGSFRPTYRVAITVQRFESTRAESIRLDAVWGVQTTATGDVRPGRTTVRETVSGDGFDALAAAHSRALSTLSADIAAAIRSAAASPPPSRG